MVQETAVVKLCECGCGQPVSIAKYSFKGRNYIKGQPVRFISGHNARLGKCTHPKFDWSDLKELYVKQQLSSNDISKIKGCHIGSVSYQLQAMGIPRRSAHEGQMIYFNRTPHSHYQTWKGGRHYQNGYILIYQPEHPRANSTGYIFEHRLVMEQKLGRHLLRSEKVHHLNGIRDDNRPENLELMSLSSHTLKEMFCSNCPLKREVRLLTWHVKELTQALQLKLKEVG